MRSRSAAVSGEEAEARALRALAFLADESERFGRFLALTGLGPQDLRSGLQSRELQAAVLGHLIADESLLLVFAASEAVPPERVVEAERILSDRRGD
ncbi:MAG: DUF3572 family protein [Hyphomicrobiaceae bacterium]